MEKSIKTTSINSTNSHIPGAYQGSPEEPVIAVEPSSIHTMKYDIVEAIKNQNESLVSMSIAENKKKDAERALEATAREAEGVVVSSAPRKVGRIVIVMVLVLVLAGVALTYKFVLPKLSKISIPSFGSSSTESLLNEPESTRVDLAPSIIKATTETRFNINKETTERMFSTVASERVTGGTQGDIKNFYFFEDISTSDGPRQTDSHELIQQNQKTVSISANKLIMLTGISAPAILTRSLENAFMAGLLNEETGSHGTPFIILKVSGYDTGFASMLEWERSLPLFFDIIFGTNIQASLTDKTKIRDVVLSSRDARVLEITPAIGIAYSFANPSTIVITSSRNALEKLIGLLPNK